MIFSLYLEVIEPHPHRYATAFKFTKSSIGLTKRVKKCINATFLDVLLKTVETCFEALELYY